MKRRVLLGIALAALGVAQRAGAQTADSLVVTTAWLAEHLRDPSLVLLHVGDRKGYDAAHLPGARFLPLDAIASSGGENALTLELPPAATLVDHLEALGVSDASRIVVYFGTDWLTPVARVYFTLDYLGLGDRASILDGGLPAWQAEKRPVTTEVPQPGRGQLTPHPRPEAVVDANWVEANRKNSAVLLVDSRAPQFYDGTERGRMPRAGHIPGARNIPFSTLADSDGRLKDLASLRRIFEDAGATAGRTVVTYCHIGQQASLDYFVARYLGYAVRLYDGSFEDWSRRSELPVVTGPEPGPGR